MLWQLVRIPCYMSMERRHSKALWMMQSFRWILKGHIRFVQMSWIREWVGIQAAHVGNSTWVTAETTKRPLEFWPTCAQNSCQEVVAHPEAVFLAVLSLAGFSPTDYKQKWCAEETGELSPFSFAIYQMDVEGKKQYYRVDRVTTLRKPESLRHQVGESIHEPGKPELHHYVSEKLTSLVHSLKCECFCVNSHQDNLTIFHINTKKLKKSDGFRKPAVESKDIK